MNYYYNQLKALIKRNILLKKVTKARTFFEIFLPILMVGITYFVNRVSETKVYKDIKPTETEDIVNNFKQFSSSLQNESKIPTIGIILPKSNNDNAIIDKIRANEMFKDTPYDFKNFENQDKMNEYNDDYHNLLIAGIVFKDDLFHYTIRVNSTSTPKPTADDIKNYIDGRFESEENGATEADSYSNIFVPIQSAVDQAIIRLKTNDDTITLKPSVGKLGKPKSEYVLTQNSGNLGFYIAVMFIMFVVVITVSLVKEKEDGIKDGLLMAGTHPTLFWLSWLILYIGICFITSLIITIFFYCTKTFSNTNPIIIFLALFLYGLCCCNIGFVLSTFFKRTKTAGTVSSVIILFISYANMALPYISMKIRKLCAIFICQISIGGFIYEIDDMENHFQNLTFSNLFTVNAGYFLLMLLLNCILYFVLAIILDNLLSNEGSRYLFNFSKKSKILDEEIDVTNEKDIQEDYNAKKGAKCMVDVDCVSKVFSKKNTDENGNKIKNKSKNKKFLAVNNVSFKVYENEIFAILGHNGAGKTTLINIMIGLLKASQGNVFYDGLDITKDLNAIRRNFGVCAQTNTIFDELTVSEHIKFYADLKNITVNIDEVLTDIDLIQQKNLKASKLSGGQKRKLCIGMATLGNPKYVFLDEPTTGLDPLSRRKIWELLVKKKQGKVIFLTTHYMDEADILADRKLILSKGKIRCLGTSLYLKNHFNMNYDLDIETSDQKRVHDIVKNYLPEATYAQDINQKTIPSIYQGSNPNQVESTNVKCHTWRLPLNSTSKFPPLLNELERQMENDQTGLVKKYALNMPTLEELFIRLEDNTVDDETDMGEQDRLINEEVLIQTDDAKLPELKEVNKLSRSKILWCLIKTRIKIFTKDKSFAFFAIIFPAITTALMFIFVQKIFNGKSTSSKENVISVSNIYPESYINLDSQANFGVTPDIMLNAISNGSGSGSGNGTLNGQVTNLNLDSIPFPKNDESYYLSSVNGEIVNNNNYKLDIHYNDTMTHSLPATLNTVSNAILASKNINDRIVVKSHLYDKNNEMLAIVGLALSGFMIGYYLSGNLGRYGPLIVRERVNQLLQQLQLNGVSRINYWISCFVSDSILFLVTCLLIFIVGVIVQYQPLMDIKVLVIIFICLVIWSIPSMIYQYIISFFFNKEETAYSIVSILNSYPVIFGYLIFMFLSMSSSTSMEEVILKGSGLFDWKCIIFNIVLTAVFPVYGIVAMVHSLFTMKMYEKLINYEFSITNLLKIRNGISPVAIVLIILSFIYFYILIRLDIKKNQTNKGDIHEMSPRTLNQYEKILEEGDDDVYEEFEYVKNHQSTLPLSVLHLSKEYKTTLPSNREKREEIKNRDPENFKFGEIHRSLYSKKYVKTAVMDVNFSVRNRECFGLLGPNGAGKSTTLNTVTSTIPQTTGKVCFDGVETHLARLGEISMGYCPQNDILWKELTLREHVEFFLSIRGYNKEESKEYATQYINAVGLEDHQHKRVDDLSGGTKRKLSLLIAICGYPKQILLDEPSAGMDPSTRRLVWNTIKKTKSMNDSALIMTTHSMEEAENLCDRLAILINGRLTCIGSPEHLKMKFGDGYILEVEAKDIDRFHKEVIENGKLFGDKEYTIEKSSNDRVKYNVKMTRNLGHIFEVMEQQKSSGLVIDYSFNQTSLEQIFINFAKEQIINTE